MSTGMGGGPNKYLKDFKSLLITALVVIITMQFVMQALIPLIPYIFAGLFLCAIIAIIFNRTNKL